MKREEVLEQAKKHFFAAMLSGWAAGVEGKPAPDLPISRYKKREEIVYEKDGFRVVDRYDTPRAGESSGTTTIWFLDEPVWVMHYDGFYRKKDIPVIKSALMLTYKKNEFLGGRGPAYFTAPFGHLVYRNSYVGVFLVFSGAELFYDGSELVGHHTYWGGSLI